MNLTISSKLQVINGVRLTLRAEEIVRLMREGRRSWYTFIPLAGVIKMTLDLQ